MDTVDIAAPAKINLDLKVTGRRDDGYHTLSTLIARIDLADMLRLRKADGFSLKVDGPFAAHAPLGDDNLVTRAARLMEQVAGKRADIAVTLTKYVPAGAGLGGGSADAAAMMHALNDLWGRPLTLDALQHHGLSLGAELPVCLGSGAYHVSGIGETLIAADMPACDGVIIWPGVTLATADVFKAYQGPFSADTRCTDPAQGQNDLQDAACSLCPAIRDALAALSGCVWARMTGSGAAVYGVCDSTEAAKETAAKLAAAHSDWWVKPCRINLPL